jgi:hypothetical protein
MCGARRTTRRLARRVPSAPAGAHGRGSRAPTVSRDPWGCRTRVRGRVLMLLRFGNASALSVPARLRSSGLLGDGRNANLLFAASSQHSRLTLPGVLVALFALFLALGRTAPRCSFLFLLFSFTHWWGLVSQQDAAHIRDGELALLLGVKLGKNAVDIIE